MEQSCKAKFHVSCSCEQCKIGAAKPVGKRVHRANEKKLRRMTKKELQQALKEVDRDQLEEVDVIRTISSPRIS